MSRRLRPEPRGTARLAGDWAWQEHAACKDEPITLFFGPPGERRVEREVRERKAKEVCAQCPVRTDCLDYAIARPEKYGTWGGLGEDERAKERRRRMRRGSRAA
ncbi:WhiB family transcriptional regulator [Nocardiopsis potens]|uniref:WhiB family transcriptional regulator n=1 Tax=Nocardiopsis potens TaxID=1246458 RepID=UPI0003450BC1|nr:WhiB family transcriptional regulator [Nocardiopsis potens]